MSSARMSIHSSFSRQAFRLLALLKIIRVAKVAKRILEWMDKFVSEGKRLTLSFVVLLLTTLWTAPPCRAMKFRRGREASMFVSACYDS